VPEDFGSLLRGYRQRALLTQEELADRTGISERTIRRLETSQLNRPRTATVRALAAELGLSPEEQAGLLAAPSGPSAAAPDGGASRGPGPAQLPMDVYGFTGRAAQLDALDALVEAGDRQPTALLITAIGGTGGVGKTALAVHWAHRVADRYPDGQLYVNLRGFAPTGVPVAPHEAVRGFLDALGVPPHRVPPGADAQVALYRSLLAAKRILIVLDNARDAEQVRPLLPGAPGCMVVVTSRDRLTPLVAAEGARPLDLDVLATGEARDLFAHRIGAARVAAEPDAVDALVTACARLPLALAIVAARAVVHPNRSLSALAEELSGGGDGLAALSAGDPTTDVRAVFSWSYRTLSPGAARLFRLLGLHHGPDAGVDAAASLAALTPAEVRPVLAELVRANLLTEHAPGRYGCHDLLRAYAGELARGTDPDGERRAATYRLLDHYLHTADAATLLLEPGAPHTTQLRPGVTVTALRDRDEALAWFTAEHAVLLAAVDHAAAAGLDEHAVQLPRCLYYFLDRRGHWTDMLRVQHVAVEAARRLDDPATEAQAHRSTANALLRLGRYAETEAHLRDAIDLAARAGDLAASANGHFHLAYLWDRQRDYAAALRENQKAMALYEAAGHRLGQARALGAVGWYQAQLGEPATALETCERAIATFEEIDDRLGLAGTLDTLGLAHRELGRYPEALAAYRRSVEVARDLGNRYYEGTALTHLGDAYLAAGDADAARDAWREGLAVLDGLHHPDAEDVRRRLAELDVTVAG
jgi:tetratricopeptide (TPR) repeat protein/transcriptional regulator with XRE-family HTH domain